MFRTWSWLCSTTRWAGQGRAGKVGQGKARQGRAGQGKAGQVECAAIQDCVVFAYSPFTSFTFTQLASPNNVSSLLLLLSF